MEWLLALAITLGSIAPLVGLWITWGVVKAMRAVVFEAGERTNQIQARWMAQQMARDKIDSALAGQALAQAENGSVTRIRSASDDFPGAQPPWDQLERLVGD